MHSRCKEPSIETYEKIEVIEQFVAQKKQITWTDLMLDMLSFKAM